MWLRFLVVYLLLSNACEALALPKYETEPHDATYCQLARNLTKFSGERSRIQAVYAYMFEVSALRSPTWCRENDSGIWLDFDSELKGSTEKTAQVSFTFDDGFESAYAKALPILDKVGVKATWYIITKYIGKPGYMTLEELQRLQADGQEIGAHTQSHPHLPTLSLQGQEAEIAGSKEDLAALGFNDVKSFAYPYGEYNSDSISALRAAGFANARTTTRETSRSPYLLQGFVIVPETTFEQVRAAIDQVQRDNTYLILIFHKIDEDGSITARHELIQQIVDYIVSKKIDVTTVGHHPTERVSD